MKYEVRYIIDNEEHADIVDVETAAEAATQVQRNHPNPSEHFELIQVQLLDDMPETPYDPETAKT